MLCWLQAATHMAHRNKLEATDLSKGLLSVLALYKEMPHAVDLPTLLTPRVLHMQVGWGCRGCPGGGMYLLSDLGVE
jgi:hypothetical protein